MFDHVKFGVSDFALSKAFFLNALAPLGVKIVAEGDPGYGIELCPERGNVSLCLFQTDEKPAHLHLAFAASSREQVDAFYHAALNAGGNLAAPSRSKIFCRLMSLTLLFPTLLISEVPQPSVWRT
ncbi:MULTISPECIES: VOC family protein [unclassified Serratia (in: enterobacteria)]|uniref:VOC family protein n=1 Tax=unclassified Serratia (in: enterobacteria) TaxID=2647522 RepID=UPI003B430DAF